MSHFNNDNEEANKKKVFNERTESNQSIESNEIKRAIVAIREIGEKRLVRPTRKN